MRSVTAAAADALRISGITKPDTEEKAEILRVYDGWAMDFQRREGREPTDEERDERMGQLAAKIRIRKPGVFNDKTARVFEFGEAGSIPENRVQAVLAGFDFAPDERTDVDAATLETAYNRAMAWSKMNGNWSPSNETLTRIIRERPWETQP